MYEYPFSLNFLQDGHDDDGELQRERKRSNSFKVVRSSKNHNVVYEVVASPTGTRPPFNLDANPASKAFGIVP